MSVTGDRIREAREGQRRGLRELARAVELSPSYVSLIENGEREPSLAALHAFATVLGVSPEWLQGSDDLSEVEVLKARVRSLEARLADLEWTVGGLKAREGARRAGRTEP